ncbi:hypothetical protein HK102_011023, partial [Quaeritorhiza haematococci]
LADASLNGLRVFSENNNIYAQLRTIISLKDSDPLQSLIAQLVSELATRPPAPVRGEVGATSAVFGVSTTDVIDTFSKTKLSLAIDPLVQPLKKTLFDLLDQLLASNGTTLPPAIGDLPFKFKVEGIDIGMPADNTLATNVDVTFEGLPNINVNLPYASVQAQVDNQALLNIFIDGMKLTSGKKLTIQTRQFFITNDPLAQKLLLLVSNLLFRRPNSVTLTASGTGIRFGASESAAFKLAQKASLSVDPTALIKKSETLFADGPDKLINLDDIQCQINNRGMVAKIRGKPLPAWLPIRARLGGIIAEVMYNMKGEFTPEYTVADAYFSQLVIQPGTFSFDLLIQARKGNELLIPLSDAAPRLLQFKDYAANALLGRAVVVSGDPFNPSDPNNKKLDALGRAYFHAPDLYFWQPIRIKPLLKNPFTRNGIEFNIQLRFPNPGPFHLDIGVFNIELVPGQNADRPLPPLVSVRTPGSLIVKNLNEGGNDTAVLNPENGVLNVVIPWSGLNPINLIRHLMELIKPKPGGNQLLKIQVIRPGEGPVSWLDEGLGQLPRDVTRNFIPIIIALLKNVRFELFGFNFGVENLPIVNRFFNDADETLRGLPPALRVELDD